jgi:hypothetical protein
VVEQRAAIDNGILPGGRRQLIDETFGDEDIVEGPTLRQNAV